MGTTKCEPGAAEHCRCNSSGSWLAQRAALCQAVPCSHGCSQRMVVLPALSRPNTCSGGQQQQRGKAASRQRQAATEAVLAVQVGASLLAPRPADWRCRPAAFLSVRGAPECVPPCRQTSSATWTPRCPAGRQPRRREISQLRPPEVGPGADRLFAHCPARTILPPVAPTPDSQCRTDCLRQGPPLVRPARDQQ